MLGAILVSEREALQEAQNFLFHADKELSKICNALTDLTDFSPDNPHDAIYQRAHALMLKADETIAVLRETARS